MLNLVPAVYFSDDDYMNFKRRHIRKMSHIWSNGVYRLAINGHIVSD